MDLEELYQELILDHAKHPRCKGAIEHPDAKASLLNPLCGDEVTLTLKYREGKVGELCFDGQGCAISQASASMMAELCKGQPVEQVQSLLQQFMAVMRGEKAAEDCPDLGDAASLEGVQRFPARIKCATLAWEAINKCLVQLSSPEISGAESQESSDALRVIDEE